MFWPLVDHSFLFLCDTFGADGNGTYYKGERGDFFVERAMDRDHRGRPARSWTCRPSAWSPRARRWAPPRRSASRSAHRLRGAIAVSPHIDLDLCAAYQGRQRHVAAIVGREDVDAPELFPSCAR